MPPCNPENGVVCMPLISASCALPCGEAHLVWDCTDADEDCMEVGIRKRQRSLRRGWLGLWGGPCLCWLMSRGWAG